MRNTTISPTQKTSIAPMPPPSPQPTFIKKIGSTTYKLNIHFSTTSKETVCDKVLRLIGNDMVVK